MRQLAGWALSAWLPETAQVAPLGQAMGWPSLRRRNSARAMPGLASPPETLAVGEMRIQRAAIGAPQGSAKVPETVSVLAVRPVPVRA